MAGERSAPAYEVFALKFFRDKTTLAYTVCKEARELGVEGQCLDVCPFTSAECLNGFKRRSKLEQLRNKAIKKSRLAVSELAEIYKLSPLTIKNIKGRS